MWGAKQMVSEAELEIIHYNTVLLSRVYKQKRAAGDQSAMDLIAGMSPVAWQHVNLFGAFDFGQTGAVDMDTLAAYYEDPAYWARIQQATPSSDQS